MVHGPKKVENQWFRSLFSLFLYAAQTISGKMRGPQFC